MTPSNKLSDILRQPTCMHCGRHFYIGLKFSIRTITSERKYNFCGKCCGYFIIGMFNEQLIKEDNLKQFVNPKL